MYAVPPSSVTMKMINPLRPHSEIPAHYCNGSIPVDVKFTFWRIVYSSPAFIFFFQRYTILIFIFQIGFIIHVFDDYSRVYSHTGGHFGLIFI